MITIIVHSKNNHKNSQNNNSDKYNSHIDKIHNIIVIEMNMKNALLKRITTTVIITIAPTMIPTAVSLRKGNIYNTNSSDKNNDNKR